MKQGNSTRPTFNPNFYQKTLELKKPRVFFRYSLSALDTLYLMILRGKKEKNSILIIIFSLITNHLLLKKFGALSFFLKGKVA